MPSSDRVRRLDWLPVAIAGGALVVCLGAAVFFALSGSTRALVLILALCTAVALVELAALTNARSKPR